MNTQALTGVLTEISYRTTDGQVFRDKVLAEEHQFDISHKEEIWWIPSNLRCEPQYDNETLNAKPMSTHELARLLLDHPDIAAKTHEGMEIDRVRTTARGGKEIAIIGEASPHPQQL